jgi:predicted flap endonuclease-1-like 5' DNA nuclease
VRIENIHIENFGNQTNCYVEDFSNRLNIVFAEDRATRDSAFQFLRWMLFGDCDEATHGVVTQTSATPAGALTVMQDGHRRTISRRDDGTRYGRLAVDGGDRYSPQTHHMVSLLGSITQQDFDYLFTPQFVGERYLGGLFRAALAQGIELHSRSIPSERRQLLLRRIEQLRSELVHQRYSEGTLSALQDRHRSLVLQIEATERDMVRRRSDLEIELSRVRDEALRARAELDRCRDRWQAKEDEVAARRAALERVWLEADRARQRLKSELHGEWHELDALVSHWKGIVSDIQRRCDRLSKTLQEIEADYRPNEKPYQCHVASLAAGIDRLRADVDHWREFPSSHDGLYRDWHSLKDRISQGLEDLRAVTSGVCDTLQGSSEHERFRAMHDELLQLEQCEQALVRWLESVERQRDRLADDLEAVDHHDVSLVWNDNYYRTRDYLYRRDHRHSDHGHADHRHADHRHADRRWEGLGHGEVRYGEYRRVPAPYVYQSLKAVRHSCDGITPADPANDRLLRELSSDRDALAREMNHLQDRCRDLHDREQMLEAELVRWNGHIAEELRRELAEVESRMREFERREALEVELRRLEDEERHLRDDVRVSAIVEHASDLLHELSGGRYRQMVVDGSLGITLVDASGHHLHWNALDAAARYDVQLALCLAAVAALRRKGVELPLLLESTDQHAMEYRHHHHENGWVQVLSHFASAGHQVVLFTGNAATRELFSARDHRYIPLNLTIARPVIEERPMVLPTPQVAVDHVRFKRRPAGELDWPAKDDDAWDTPSPVRRDSGERVRPSRPVERRSDRQADPAPLNVIHWDTPIHRTQLIDADVADYLNSTGVTSVRRFLELEVDEIEERLRPTGMIARPVRRWQDELELCCWLRDLPVEDARLLVACGINDVSELADAEIDGLYDTASRYLTTHENFRRSHRPLTRDLITRWIDTARYCRSSWNGRGRRERLQHTTSVTMPLREVGQRERRRPQATRDLDLERSADRDARRLERRSRPDRDARRRRDESNYAAESSGMARSNGASKTELRFYLNLEDPVVDAPSIGPRTAERLQEIGVRTVRELLDADPESLSKQLGNSRFTAKVVREWQAQATLACRIPQLRGHDAQILVACEVTDPSQLAAMDENELWSRVRPFVRTAEGKRIIRSGKAPDIDEVREWILWAKNARQLRAA